MMFARQLPTRPVVSLAGAPLLPLRTSLTRTVLASATASSARLSSRSLSTKDSRDIPASASTSTSTSTSAKPLAIERELPSGSNGDASGSGYSRNKLLAFGVAGVALWAGSLIVMFNYQRQTTSAVAGAYYTARQHKLVREAIGDKVTYASKWPWISGSINNLKGRIDIGFWVQGDKGQGYIRLRTIRPAIQAPWHTVEYTLTTKDGEVINLAATRNVDDPIMLLASRSENP